MNIISFVSLGPGDPELITIKGLKILQDADVILTPSTNRNGKEIVSRSKDILTALKIEEEKIKLFHIPMSKERLETLKNYEATAKLVEEYYSKDLKIAIVAEGDSGFYSSSQYINEELMKIDIPTQRVGGVPAFIACAALANIHIAKQEEQLVVIPGKTDSNELISYLNSNKSVIIMKPSMSEDIIKEFIHSENKMQFHYFENAGIAGKELYVSTRDEILNRKFPYFSLLIIQNNSSI